jgi:hypothetical protein
MAGSVFGILMVAVIVVLVVIAGMTLFLLALIVPVAGFFLLLPLFKALGRGSMRRKSGAPTSAEASYDPVREPRTRG